MSNSALPRFEEHTSDAEAHSLSPVKTRMAFPMRKKAGLCDDDQTRNLVAVYLLHGNLW